MKKTGENRKVNRRKVCAAGMVFLSVLTIGAPLTAFADQSPLMAYTQEQWDALRDNNLEYSEIDMLIHEYNPTVLQNAITLKDYKGTSSADISNDYYDAANDILENVQYPDEGSSNYASAVSSYLSAQIQAENLTKQGDTNTDDEETYKLLYAQSEAEIAKEAKLLMVDYWKGTYNLETYRNNVTTAQANLEKVKRQVAAGTATSSQVQTAEQTLTTAQTTLQNAEVQLNSTKEQLCLMCGWSYGSNANIGSLPEVTADMIAAIDLNADTQKALENNYSLKSTTRQLSNAQTDTVTERLTATKSTSEQNIRSNVNDLYVKLQSAQTDLQSAQETLSVKEAAKSAADRKKAAGMITDNDYNQTVFSYQSANVSVQNAKLALLTAYINYEAAVNGLAST